MLAPLLLSLPLLALIVAVFWAVWPETEDGWQGMCALAALAAFVSAAPLAFALDAAAG